MEIKEGRIGQKQRENFFKLYLNEYEDFILINESDSGIFDRYAEFLKWLDEKGIDIQKSEEKLREIYGNDIVKRDDDGNVVDVNTDAFLALSKLRTDTYRETCEQIDRIFGKDTCRKYFRESYEINPDFVPDDECIYDFLEEITPVLNNIFADRKKRIELKYNKNRKGGKANNYRTKDQLLADCRK